jgi:hypothetical protein
LATALAISAQTVKGAAEMLRKGSSEQLMIVLPHRKVAPLPD